MDGLGSLREQLEALKGLNRSRFDYVLARAQCTSISEALNKVGLSSSWYYKFSDEERKQLEEFAAWLHAERALKAFYILEEAAENAAQVKVDGLKHKDPRIKQSCATEILDRVAGKPTQTVKQEINAEIKLVELKWNDGDSN